MCGTRGTFFKDKRRGAVLILVLFVLTGLSVLTVEFSRDILLDHAMSTSTRSILAAKPLMESGERLATAVKKFYLDNGFYPSTEQGLEALVTRPAIGKTPKNYPANGYITKIPKDPWGNDYVYTAPGQKVPFEIMSLGSDGAEGGEGEAADFWGEDVPDR